MKENNNKVLDIFDWSRNVCDPNYFLVKDKKKDPPPPEPQYSLSQFATNYLKSQFWTTYDTALWTADKLGLSSNITNFLRDIPNAIKYKLCTLPPAILQAIINYAKGKGFTIEESYNYYLKNPSFFQRMNTIEPLPNSNSNYSTKEMDVIKDMAGNKSCITNADIKRVSGRYGNNSSISSYITEPDKVVQTSIGQSSGSNGHLHDIFDTNVSTETAKKDNKKYMEGAKSNPGFNYFTLRAIMPFIGSTDIMPDNYKIHTYIDLNH
ncbi:MAG: hypothetical protein PUC50_07560 [Bacteroidales bacterium]|nr:hypothetical protein [Bacteroidales bacterium]